MASLSTIWQWNFLVCYITFYDNVVRQFCSMSISLDQIVIWLRNYRFSFSGFTASFPSSLFATTQIVPQSIRNWALNSNSHNSIRSIYYDDVKPFSIRRPRKVTSSSYSLPNLLKELAFITYELKALKVLFGRHENFSKSEVDEPKALPPEHEWLKQKEENLANCK